MKQSLESCLRAYHPLKHLQAQVVGLTLLQAHVSGQQIARQVRSLASHSKVALQDNG